MSFKGKVIIVTGSSSGIGREAALIFAKEGASVTIHGGTSTERLKETEALLKKQGVPESRIHSVLGPIEDEKVQKRLIDETVKKFGRLDVLVNNAATPRHPDLDTNSLENLDYVLGTNLKSVIALTELAIPHLTKTKGNVVNVSSGIVNTVSPHAVPYALSKAALDLYSRNMAVKFAEFGVRVNTVSPGVTISNFGTRHQLSADAMQKFYKKIADERIPMRRLGTAKEVANGIEFVASDKASYMTGSVLLIDGGLLAGPPTPKTDGKPAEK